MQRFNMPDDRQMKACVASKCGESYEKLADKLKISAHILRNYFETNASSAMKLDRTEAIFQRAKGYKYK